MKQEVVDQPRLTDLLRDLSARDARVEPPVRVQHAVMTRWAERRADSPLPMDTAARRVFPLRPRWTHAAAGLAGIAAMLLLVVWGRDRSVKAPPPHVSAVHVATPSVDFAPPVLPRSPEPLHDRIEAPAAAARSMKPATTAVRAAPEDIEPFVRLLPITEQELTGIRLARVRMRGQAAQTLGLDLRIPLPGADGFVEADVLLGEDGLARAIRFVR